MSTDDNETSWSARDASTRREGGAGSAGPPTERTNNFGSDPAPMAEGQTRALRDELTSAKDGLARTESDLEKTLQALAVSQQELAEERKRREQAAEIAAGVRGRYFFTLKSDLEPVENKNRIVGFEVPEGIRLHINYKPKPNQVFTEDHPLTAKGLFAGWHGLDGEIVSGGDWILIQKDGVARFDARVTIKTEDHFLIDAVFSGAVDLVAAVPSLRVADVRDLGRAVYERYERGGPEDKELPVRLSVRFEAAEKPSLRPGEDDSWIKKSRYAKQIDLFPRYQWLVRGLFVGRGAVTLGDDKRWPPRSIWLRIHELV
jgi:hypothetical protein